MAPAHSTSAIERDKRCFGTGATLRHNGVEENTDSLSEIDTQKKTSFGRKIIKQYL